MRQPALEVLGQRGDLDTIVAKALKKLPAATPMRLRRRNLATR